MKRMILISVTILVLVLIYFGYKFIKNIIGMVPAEDIEIPSIETVSSIEDIVQSYISHTTTKGLSIGVFNKGKISYYNYGICSDDKPIPPTNQSIYEIGSITKTFTTTVLAQMIQEGKVQLKDPISKHLDQEKLNWSSDTITITLGELATHHSGLPRIPLNQLKQSFFHFDNPYKSYGKSEMYNFLKTYTPKPVAKRKSSYSNFGMGLLGTILADIDGISYEEMIANRITKPLNMHHTFIDRAGKDILKGHNGYGAITSPWDFQAMAGAGSIRSTSEDLMKYMVANLEEQSPFVDTHYPQADFSEKEKIGLGWILIPTKKEDDTGIFHNGSTGGFQSAMAFFKERQTGVIVLSNSIQAVDAICFRIAQLLDKNQDIAQ